MSNKRFQECNTIVKIWRYRWYLLIPIKWVWYSTVKKFKVGIDEIENGAMKHTDRYEVAVKYNLWKILKGEAQSKMLWYHTMEEVQEYFKKYIDDDDDNK